METVFLASFIFGALFTAVSALLGFAGGTVHLGHDAHLGHGANGGPPGHAGHEAELPHHVGHAGHDLTAQHPAVGHETQTAAHPGPSQGLPVLNVSALLAFLTWFGAAGYLLLRFAAWPLIAALPVAVVAGIAGALVIARFLAAVLAGEREMNPAEYELEGTIARVTITIPAGGVGEIVFSKGGVRRSEAARGLNGHAIPYDTEVVIIDYTGGIATVQPWAELLTGRNPEALEEGPPTDDAGT